MDIFPLTASQRARIWTRLNPQQRAIFDKYTMYRIKSELLNNAFRLDANWNLVGVHIDQTWDIDGGRGGAAHKYHCECGRPIKYQFELRPTSRRGRHLLLGSSCFARYAGIPAQVAREIQGQVTTIQIYMNQILVKWDRGERFPEIQFGGVMDSGIFTAPSVFGQKITDFRAADLPLFANDYSRMVRYQAAYLNGAVLDLRGQNECRVALNEPAAKPLTPLAATDFLQYPHKDCLLVQDAFYPDRPMPLKEQAQLLTTMLNLNELFELYQRTQSATANADYLTALRNSVKHTVALLPKVRLTRDAGGVLDDLYSAMLAEKPLRECLLVGLRAETSVWLHGRSNLPLTMKSLRKMLKRTLVYASVTGTPNKPELQALAQKLRQRQALPTLEAIQAICRLYAEVGRPAAELASAISAAEHALATAGTQVDPRTFNRGQIPQPARTKQKRVIKVMSRKRGLRGSTKLSTEQYEMQLALRHRKKHDKPMQ